MSTEIDPVVLAGHDPKSPHSTGEQVRAALKEVRAIAKDGTVSLSELQEALDRQIPGSVSR